MNRRTAGALLALPVLAGLLVSGSQAAPAGPDEATDGLAISNDLRVRVRAGRDIELGVRLREGEGIPDAARRIGTDEPPVEALKIWNTGRAHDDPWIWVPLALLSDDLRSLLLLTLFPEDRIDGDAWVHRARAGKLPTYAAGLWQVAEWFTGSGDRFEELMRMNRLAAPELSAGQPIRIPTSMLHASLRPRERSDDASLEYGSDASGPYAGYRLKPGEALYSAVVLRFTGRDSAEDVRSLAGELARRSGIRDLTDIPANYLIKIPLDYLEPEFLPKRHPRRLEAEAARAEMAETLAQDPVRRTEGGLKGVVIVLDPGHGGRDLGTMHNGIWEHDYVYDVTCRLKRELERHTAATVVMTLEDAETGCVPSRGDRLAKNRQGTIRTDPPFLAVKEGEADIGVNLRWYLANSVYRKARKEGVSDDRIVFLSIHADSRDPRLRGAMVYVPGAKYRTKTYGKTGKTYGRYREVREQPTIRFSYKDRVRSEAVSRKLGESLIAALRAMHLPVQPHQPIRNRVIRGRSVWVPAVLRSNAVPAKVLIELVNLGNKKDARLLGSAAQRERLADALFLGLFRHFREKPPKREADSPRAAR